MSFEGEEIDESSDIDPVRCSQYATGDDIQSDEVVNGPTTSASEDENPFGPFAKYCYKKKVIATNPS